MFKSVFGGGASKSAGLLHLLILIFLVRAVPALTQAPIYALLVTQISQEIVCVTCAEGFT